MFVSLVVVRAGAFVSVSRFKEKVFMCFKKIIMPNLLTLLSCEPSDRLIFFVDFPTYYRKNKLLSFLIITFQLCTVVTHFLDLSLSRFLSPLFLNLPSRSLYLPHIL